ncbi:hypothetical protein BKD30_14115 [Tersicoccus phoenicis]|uniref:Uncharacterized protein n=1 Tax=Tersicoccus phoenicis TaxID=554083 RepID=A0A1R1L6J7_9MICC|nr:hypothetical protein [Tersicoccus phoenicis]OMH23171.1 hypothetical protein BKD30_14115 [Tersicoccus phoenicis]
MDHWASFPWWLIFPIWAMAGGGFAASRRARRKVRQTPRTAGPPRRPSAADARAEQRAQRERQLASARQLIADHDAVNGRWLTYELDVARLIDFPMMTDVREPLTVDFIRAKRTADGLRPRSPEALLADDGVAEYRDAVRRFEVAFDLAEREALRVRDGHYTEADQRRLAHARQLLRVAVDPGATANERQVAYTRVHRELEGVIVLPVEAVAGLERRVVLGLPAGSRLRRPADGAA